MKIILHPKPDEQYLKLNGRDATIEAWNRAKTYKRPDGTPDNQLFLEHISAWRKENEKPSRRSYRRRRTATSK